jgi:hypothetical protein
MPWQLVLSLMCVVFFMFLMFVLTLADDSCCVWFIYPILCWYWFPEIGTNSTDWAELCRLLFEDGDRIQSLKYCVLIQNRTMDNVQKLNCINIPSSQTFISYLVINVFKEPAIFISRADAGRSKFL